ncbi:succinate--CoA ligase subunit alpha [Oceanobacillus saliphilus]|uniref:succinate--CoA ligase subunit alpha n=1 Tax=Oceanobacillus saliphilus TaxID=2925834 RepID=UPI00201D4B90|nr:succinate--CoA ligase subunit alpha [Oceanobacillus saliphilus]
MSVLIHDKTKVLIQGLTAKIAYKHAINMAKNNTQIVAGVVPSKGGTMVGSWPIYDTVKEALLEHKVDLSLIYAPAKYAAKAIIESIDANVELIVCVTEGIPIHEMLYVHSLLEHSNSTLIGPCSPGIYTPGKSKIGFIPDKVVLPGTVGVVGKSGTLTYEICYQLKEAGIGQSTIIGIGGDPIKGFSFIDALRLFEEDDETNCVVLVGEIGGNEEEECARYVRKHIQKPVISFIAGKNAPEGKPMGHAGALISKTEGSYQSKIEELKRNGIYVANSLFEVKDLAIKFSKF